MNPLLQFVPFWSYYLKHPSADSLALVSPPHPIPFLVLGYAVYRWLWKGTLADLRTGRTKPVGLLLVCLISLVALALATPNASVTLDRSNGTVTLRRFYIFWVPYIKHLSLADVAGASTQEAPFSSRFYLKMNNGDRYYLAEWDAARGQGTGANAINDFLEASPAWLAAHGKQP